MKTNADLVSALQGVLAHVHAGPKDAQAWADIVGTLSAAKGYAQKAVKILAATEGFTSGVSGAKVAVK